VLCGEAGAVAVTVDGQALDGEVVTQNGSTYVPLRSLLDALGGWEAVWDNDARTARADTDLFSLDVPIAQLRVLANGFAYTLSGAPFIRDGRTYVPLRSVANLLGAEVAFLGWSLPVAVTTRTAMPYTEEDIYWLSRIISAESQGECLAGQIAVGNVVLNRVASKKFPNTIRAVVFDKKDAVQFEPVSNGTVYNTPTPQSVLAARLALNGANVVGDCMYFFNPALSKGAWIRQNCTYYTTIGCHRFYTD